MFLHRLPVHLLILLLEAWWKRTVISLYAYTEQLECFQLFLVPQVLIEIFCLLFHLQALTSSSVYGFGHHNIRKGIKLLGEHPKAGHRNGEGSGGEVMRSSWGHLVYSAWRRGDSGGDLIVVYRFLMRGSAGAWSLFSGDNDRTRGNDAKLCQESFSSDVGKSFFPQGFR